MVSYIRLKGFRCNGGAGVVALVLLLLLGSLTGCGQPDFERGRSLLEKGRWDAATKHWKALLNDFGPQLDEGQRLEALLSLAKASEEIGEVECTIRCLEEAQELDPQDPFLLQRLFAYYARYAPQSSGRLRPSDVLRAVERIESFAASGERGDCPEGLSLHGLLEKALSQNVDLPHAHYGLGLLASCPPVDLETARKAFASSLLADEGHERARLRLAWVLLQQGRKSLAAELLRKGWTRGERSPALCLALARTLMETRQEAERPLALDCLFELKTRFKETFDDLVANASFPGIDSWLDELQKLEEQRATLRDVQELASMNNRLRQVPVTKSPASRGPRPSRAGDSSSSGSSSGLRFLASTRDRSTATKGGGSGSSRLGQTFVSKGIRQRGRAPTTEQLRIFRFGN